LRSLPKWPESEALLAARRINAPAAIRGTTRQQWLTWFRWRLSLMRGEYWYWGLPGLRIVGRALQRRADRREAAADQAWGR
jgi:hypothetical protein